MVENEDDNDMASSICAPECACTVTALSTSLRSSEMKVKVKCSTLFHQLES